MDPSSTAKASNLYELLSAIAADPEQENPIEAIRSTLKKFAEVLAPLLDEDPREWTVYVERHIAGIRFILRDTSSREVNLQALPADAKDLEEWLS